MANLAELVYRESVPFDLWAHSAKRYIYHANTGSD